MSGGFDVGSIIGHLILSKEQWEQAVAAVKKDVQDLNEHVQKNSAEFKKLGQEMAVAGAAITASLGAVVKMTADIGDEFNNLSMRTGIASSALSAYKLAADKSSVSMGEFAVGMKGLAQSMVETNKKSSDAGKAFGSLGVSTKDSGGHMRSMDAVLLDVAGAFSKMPAGADKAALAVQLFGKSGMSMVEFLNLGKDGLQENIDKARQYGMIVGAEAAAAGDRFNESLADLKGALQGTGMTIGNMILPQVEGLVQQITAVVAKIGQWASRHEALSTSLLSFAGAAGGLLVSMGTIVMTLPTMLKGFGDLEKVLKLSTAGVWGMYAGLTAVLAAAAATYTITTNLIQAKNRLTEADLTAAATNQKLGEKLRAAADAAGLTRREFVALTEKYGGNNAALAMAIKHGKEGVEIQEALAKSGAKNAAAQLKSADGLKALAAALAELGVKTRSELLEDLNKTEAALKNLKGTTEQTPGAVKALEERAKGLREQLYGVVGLTDQETDSLKDLIKTADPFHAKLEEISKSQALVEKAFNTGKVKADDYRRVLAYLREEMQQLTALPKQSASAWDKFVDSLIKDGPKITDFGQKVGGAFDNIDDKTDEMGKIWDTAIGTMMSTMVQFGDGTGSILSGAGKAWTSFAETAIAASEMETVKLLSDSDAYIAAKKKETMASYIASLFKSFGIFAIPLAAAAFAVVNALFAKIMKFEEGGQFNKATLAVLGEGKDTEYALPEKKLVNIVRDAMSGGGLKASGMSLAPAGAGTGRMGGGYAFSISGPLIHTTGVSRRDLQAAGPELAKEVNRQLRRNVRLRRR